MDEQRTGGPHSEVLHSVVNGPLLQGQNVYLGSGGPAAYRPPRQLPATVGTFTGREGSLAELDTLVTDLEHADSGSVTVCAIVGTAGVGKTELAVRWGQRVRARFPHGQLFVDLRGFTPGMCPARPEDVLPALLRSLGVPGEQVPVDVNEQSALYRDILSDKRVLVVLDNAASAEQVRPLVPAAPGCLLLVTSRHDLADLAATHDVHHVSLSSLAPHESLALLTGLLGETQIGADLAEVTRLAGLCAHLPLALRIAAAHIAMRPHQQLCRYVGALATGDRLSLLSTGSSDSQTAVRAVFDVSYNELPAEARALFRFIGVAPGPSITPSVAAHLADIPKSEAARILDSLCSSHLIDPIGDERYAFHDLLRLYARERADTEESVTERDAALLRLFDFYIHSTDAAVRLLRDRPTWITRPVEHPKVTPLTFQTGAEAAEWLDEERPNLVAAVTHAAQYSMPSHAWHLVDALRDFYWRRGFSTDWLSLGRTGLTLAEKAGNRTAEATMHLALGEALAFSRS